VAAAIVGAAASVLGSLFKRGPDPRIQADIIPAYQRGDVAYLVAWINDQPPHPADSVAAARQALAQLTGSPYYGGRVNQTYPGQYAASPTAPAPMPSMAPQAPPVAGYLPVRTSQGVVGVPFVR